MYWGARICRGVEDSATANMREDPTTGNMSCIVRRLAADLNWHRYRAIGASRLSKKFLAILSTSVLSNVFTR